MCEVNLKVLRYSEEGFEIELVDNNYIKINVILFGGAFYNIEPGELDEEITVKEVELRALKKAKQFWGGE